MEKENKVVDMATPDTNKPAQGDVNYIKVIDDLKQNTVRKEEYQKLLEENKKLLNAYVEYSGPSNVEQEPQEKVDVTELRKKLSTDLTNLEYVSTALKLRTELMKQGQPDPFLPVGHKVSPTANDYEKAEQVAQVFQECVEKANGNPTDFTIALKGRTRDDVSFKRANGSTAGRIIN